MNKYAIVGGLLVVIIIVGFFFVSIGPTAGVGAKMRAEFYNDGELVGTDESLAFVADGVTITDIVMWFGWTTTIVPAKTAADDLDISGKWWLVASVNTMYGGTLHTWPDNFFGFDHAAEEHEWSVSFHVDDLLSAYMDYTSSGWVLAFNMEIDGTYTTGDGQVYESSDAARFTITITWEGAEFALSAVLHD